MNTREHLNEEELAFYVDALRLHRVEALPADMLEHVQSCMPCKTSIMQLSSLVPDDVFSKRGRHPYFDRPTLLDRLKKNSDGFLRIAASIIAVSAVGAILYYVLSRGTEPHSESGHMNAGKADTASEKNQGQVAQESPLLAQAERFTPLPMLEGLAQHEFRSPSYRPIQPANADTMTQGQMFVWEGKVGSDPYDFVIVTNRGKEAVRATVRTEKYQLTRRLPEGLYYWKVERGGELVFVRKFFVIEK